MNNTKDLYQQYVERAQKIADLNYAAAVLDWDRETYMPVKGAAARARQLATLRGMAHQLFTEKSYGDLLQNLLDKSDELSGKEKQNIILSKEDFDKQTKLPSAFVHELSETISRAYQSWMDARKQNNFTVFEPALNKLVSLKQQEADLLGYSAHPYDALLKDYEKSASVKMLDELFESMTKPLQDLLSKVLAKQNADAGFLHRHYPKDTQWNWGMYLIKELGFDFEAGRQDISEHPFTTNFSSQDVRVTTRIDEQDFANMTWSCIHEAGHALYEQGLPNADYGLPSGEFASLSIHESQSRFWENCVGRSLPFWQYYFPKLQSCFPAQLQDISLEKFYGAINKVQPSLIRTESDELTYHFHVRIRYIMDKELIGGNLSTKNVRERWNELYKENLGIEVPDDNRGSLQDVHWSHGSFGYFPTYSLGSFYAAQFWAKLKEENPSAEKEISEGNVTNILSWLRKNIHTKGRTGGDSEALCKSITGKPLQTVAFLEYLTQKLL
ncbi:carboxypeptidase [Arachidicoccus ginsenosidimutans]|uniref:carboxypeptidase M32 n=1 Tax=Arachidicoccus sp. BS20 TaxID=1850526 RepID=UPI0007F17C1A|nr:carboxypeptidase M32 [Arachidicoccus sp. BS20]ANI88901.1 carboxypeptidase [Arachidicoccus sp. BS20]